MKRKKKCQWLTLPLLLLLAACASAPKPAPEPWAPSNPAPEPSPVVDTRKPGDATIDYVALQRSLGLERAQSVLGYQEKGFNTCKAGYGFSGVHDCQSKYFVVIHFQLKCREFEESPLAPLTQADLTPISNRPVKWVIKPVEGYSQLDSDGYAQIRLIAPQSLRNQRLKLTVGNDFLYIRAEEITQIATPKSWCE